MPQGGLTGKTDELVWENLIDHRDFLVSQTEDNSLNVQYLFVNLQCKIQGGVASLDQEKNGATLLVALSSFKEVVEVPGWGLVDLKDDISRL